MAEFCNCGSIMTEAGCTNRACPNRAPEGKSKAKSRTPVKRKL